MGFCLIHCFLGFFLTDCSAIVHKGCKESFASCAKVKMKVRDFIYSTEQTKKFMQIYNTFYHMAQSFQLDSSCKELEPLCWSFHVMKTVKYTVYMMKTQNLCLPQMQGIFFSKLSNVCAIMISVHFSIVITFTFSYLLHISPSVILPISFRENKKCI